MSFTPPPPPVFASKNYHIWVVKMKTYLQAHDLLNVVKNGIKPAPLRANPTIAQIRQHSKKCAKKHKVMACLQNGVSDVIFNRIIDMATVNNIRLLGDNFSESRVVEKYKSCKQFGHVEKVCKNKIRAQAQQQNQAQAAEDIQAQEEHVFTASCFATSSKVRRD
ncbi:hypothetical protein CXB51_033789 [Gossypium anomalum]|uniref:DUF4219 domain-containing protein n=1 Tax=Gossypium anomalum TaxID=47600 RepID=A0A8J5Y3E2_9ROSI|nr:hypothetical protein CXB51_033789 [Gossypium anomalum]